MGSGNITKLSMLAFPNGRTAEVFENLQHEYDWFGRAYDYIAIYS